MQIIIYLYLVSYDAPSLAKRHNVISPPPPSFFDPVSLCYFLYFKCLFS